MSSWSSWRRTAAVAGVAALLGLAACGGGGGGDDSAPTVVGPPATAATLSASTGEAASAMQGAVESAARAVELSASLGQGVAPIGSGGAASPLAVRTPTREQAKLRETVSCAEFIAVPGCTGSITIDTNLAANATVVGPGTYVTLSFGNVWASSGGDSLTLNGTIRTDFLTTFDLAATSLANQRLQLTFDALSGSANGVSFGPLSLAALVEFDALELSTVTMDGVRLSRLENISVTNAANFALVNVALRRAAWSSASAHVDYAFGNWIVVDGRPGVGATATVSAGANSIALTVTGATSTTVVSSAVVTIGGVTTAYTVTATYPAGGGAPSYVAVPSGS